MPVTPFTDGEALSSVRAKLNEIRLTSEQNSLAIAAGSAFGNTWTELVAITGQGTGQMGFVSDQDDGTHMQGTAIGYAGDYVDNAGTYSWNDDWGVWLRVAGGVLGEVTVNLIATGADTITATADRAYSGDAYAATFRLVPAEDNTGPVTLSIGGSTAKSVVLNTGEALASGYLQAGGIYDLVDDGTYYRLTSGATATSIETAATDAAAAALASKVAAGVSATSASGAAAAAASSASNASASAATAADNIDATLYNTKALADTGLAGLSNGDYAMVLVDETRNDRRTIYQVVSSAYVYIRTLSGFSDEELSVATRVSSLASLLTDTRTYTEFSEDDLIYVVDRGYTFKVLASADPDADQTTAGSVALEALPDASGYIAFEQLGAVDDGSTDNLAAINKGVGRKVRGTPGATYFVDITSYTDTIHITDGTYWILKGCKFEWDYFGAPLFYIAPGTVDVKIDDPWVVWDGDPTLAQGFSGSTLRTYFDCTDGTNTVYCCNWLIVACDDVVINRPRCSSKTPGPFKSIYINIALRADYDGDTGERLVITDPWCDDYMMGIQGSGFEELQITGNIYGGRYDDYSTNYACAEPFAPGHLIYLSGIGPEGDRYSNENAIIGDVFDRGLYQGANPGAGGYNAVKFRFVDGLTTGTVWSERPHGLFDGFGIRNAHFGPMYWKSDAVRMWDVAYDGGTGDFTVGEVVTAASGGTFEVVSLVGDTVSGTLTVKLLDGIVADDDVLTGDDTGLAVANGPDRWELDFDGGTVRMAVGESILADSGGTFTIETIKGSTETGSLTLTGLVGTVANNDALTGAVAGEAVAKDTPVSVGMPVDNVSGYLSNAMVRMTNNTPDGGEASSSRDIVFEDITLVSPALEVRPLQWSGHASFPHEDVKIHKLSLTMDVSRMSTSVMEFANCTRCSVEDLTLNLSGTLDSEILISLDGVTSHTYINARMTGDVAVQRVTNSGSGGSNVIHLDGPSGMPFYTPSEEGGTLTRTEGYSIRTKPLHFSGDIKRFLSNTGDAATVDFEIPRGHFNCVVTIWDRNSVAATVYRTYHLAWWESGGSLVIADAVPVFDARTTGTIFDDLVLSVASDGVVTVDVTFLTGQGQDTEASIGITSTAALRDSVV